MQGIRPAWARKKPLRAVRVIMPWVNAMGSWAVVMHAATRGSKTHLSRTPLFFLQQSIS
jgi:hypothetical protein